MKVVILCGGKGIRSFPFTSYMPKPMLPIGGTPVLVHVIKSFVAQGFNQFILSAGYRRSVLTDYFEGKQFGAEITIVDTGEDTDTGGRIWGCRDLLDGRFMATYADGLCSVSLARLLHFHESHRGLVTMTSVPMYSQYGVMTIDESGKVAEMLEKPLIRDHWINAGFMVFEKEVFDHWQGQSLERHVLPHLVSKGVVYSYRHDGFFKSVDSYKDVMEFEELLETRATPWMVER